MNHLSDETAHDNVFEFAKTGYESRCPSCNWLSPEKVFVENVGDPITCNHCEKAKAELDGEE